MKPQVPIIINIIWIGHYALIVTYAYILHKTLLLPCCKILLNSTDFSSGLKKSDKQFITEPYAQ